MVDDDAYWHTLPMSIWWKWVFQKGRTTTWRVTGANSFAEIVDQRFIHRGEIYLRYSFAGNSRVRLHEHCR